MSMRKIVDGVMKGIGYTRKGAGDSVHPAYLPDPGTRERMPKWDYNKLYTEAEQNWFIQMVVQWIVRLSKRPGWVIKRRFLQKCRKCGKEFTEEVDECDICGGKRFEKPNIQEYRRITELLNHPNSNKESFGDILGSIIYHDTIADKWLLSVAYAPLITNGDVTSTYTPAEIYVENPANIRDIMNERGRRGMPGGDAIYFCQHCYPIHQDAINKGVPKQCPICGSMMVPAWFSQNINDEITNLFGEDEMVMGSTYRVLPDPDPQPRMVSIWRSLHTLKYIDEWFLDSYGKSALAKIIILFNKRQDEVDEIAEAVKLQRDKLDAIDVTTGNARTKKTAQTLMLGGADGAAVFDVMPDPVAMRALEYYMIHVAGIASVFGVQVTFLNMEQKSSQGGSAPAVKLEIQNHVIEEIQRDKMEVFNNQLFPLFGIKDWILVFNPLEKKDELNEAKINQSTSNTLINLAQIPGMKVRVDESGKMTYSGEFNGGALSRGMRPDGESSPTPKESESSTRIIEGTTTERNPKEPREKSTPIDLNINISADPQVIQIENEPIQVVVKQQTNPEFDKKRLEIMKSLMGGDEE